MSSRTKHATHFIDRTLQLILLVPFFKNSISELKSNMIQNVDSILIEWDLFNAICLLGAFFNRTSTNEEGNIVFLPIVQDC